MKIRYYGHSCFAFTNQQGRVLVIDPYESGSYGGAVKYPPVTVAADLALVSHQHEDHNHTASLTGSFERYTGTQPKTIHGYSIKGYATFHDKTRGSERGPNTMHRIDTDGLRILHTGDLGHAIGDEAVQWAGELDLLCCPVGGFYTIDAAEAWALVEQLKPRVVIPIHYKTDGVGFPIAPVEDFLRKVKGREVRRQPCQVELLPAKLPKAPEVWVLAYR